ncbi:MAG TPA: 16S rRNA (guanine(966)-N(2))-methyltransferase RsmD [Gammaproteobacteria bacterium]|nr:16S rRNA (guanine(966)-N(2))-methyltransferase RsmD [Gammaproteobacteria bacterium]
MPKPSRGQLRIIGGHWRGRKLPIAEVEGLRPTPDRVRETLFNWLQGEIADSVCVDLFAGTGALALEALSRGAAQVIAVEQNRRACDQLRRSAEQLGTDRLQVVCASVEEFLTSEIDTATGEPWQILFVDPPYQLGFPPPQWQPLSDHPKLASEALVYLESARQYQQIDLQLEYPQWQTMRCKVAGEVCYRLLQRLQA